MLLTGFAAITIDYERMPFCFIPPMPKKKDNEETLTVFLLGQTPVTQTQWCNFMCENPSYFKGPYRPVENVSNFWVKWFLKKIAHSRLPTIAEWEWACRAGTSGKYYSTMLNDIAWWEFNSGGETHPVALKKPNAFGLHDMLGNVSEMMLDWAGDRYIYLKGGNFDSLAIYLERTDQDFSNEAYRDVGFRILIDIKKGMYVKDGTLQNRHG